MHENNEYVSLLDSLINWFKRLLIEDSPPEPRETPANCLPAYKLRRLERCLKKDCETEINRKKLESYWQEMLKYE